MLPGIDRKVVLEFFFWRAHHSRRDRNGPLPGRTIIAKKRMKFGHQVHNGLQRLLTRTVIVESSQVDAASTEHLKIELTSEI